MGGGVLSDMGVEGLGDVRIESACTQCVVFAYSAECSPFHYPPSNPYHISVVINGSIIRFFGGLGIMFHPPCKSYL